MKRLVYVLLALAVSTGAFAQTSGDAGRGSHKSPATQERPEGAPAKGADHEKFEAQKVAFITEQLSLTVEEAQAFWPVYNQAQKEQREGFEAVREAKKALRDAVKDGKSDKEIKPLLDKYLKAKASQKDAMAEHRSDFVKAVGETKTAKLFLSEDSFRNKALREMAGQGSSVGRGPKGNGQGSGKGFGPQFGRGAGKGGFAPGSGNDSGSGFGPGASSGQTTL